MSKVKSNKGSIRQLVRRLYTRPSTPFAIIGPPGMGKTAQTIAAAKEIGYPYKIFIASTCEETDIAGLPALVDGRTTTITPEWGIEFGKRPGVLILDELNRARPEVLNAMLTLIQDRTFPNGKDRLHPHTIIIALMNDAQMVGAEELCPAMNNRFGWIEMTQPSEDEFVRWLNTGSNEYETVEDKKKGMTEESLAAPEFEPITMEEWLAFYQAADENCADLKELLRRAKATEMQFASDDMFTQQRRTCTPRSLTNLFYFSGDAQHVSRYAKFFLDDRNANIFKTALKKMKDSASNVAMRSDREKLPTSDSPDRIANAQTLDAAIQQQTSFLSRALGEDDEE